MPRKWKLFPYSPAATRIVSPGLAEATAFSNPAASFTRCVSAARSGPADRIAMVERMVRGIGASNLPSDHVVQVRVVADVARRRRGGRRVERGAERGE